MKNFCENFIPGHLFEAERLFYLRNMSSRTLIQDRTCIRNFRVEAESLFDLVFYMQKYVMKNMLHTQRIFKGSTSTITFIKNRLIKDCTNRDIQNRLEAILWSRIGLFDKTSYLCTSTLLSLSLLNMLSFLDQAFQMRYYTPLGLKGLQNCQRSTFELKDLLKDTHQHL